MRWGGVFCINERKNHKIRRNGSPGLGFDVKEHPVAIGATGETILTGTDWPPDGICHSCSDRMA